MFWEPLEWNASRRRAGHRGRKIAEAEEQSHAGRPALAAAAPAASALVLIASRQPLCIQQDLKEIADNIRGPCFGMTVGPGDNERTNERTHQPHNDDDDDDDETDSGGLEPEPHHQGFLLDTLDSAESTVKYYII